LQRLAPDNFVRTFDQLVVLVVLLLLIWAGLDTLHAEVGSEFMPDGSYGWACYLLLGLFACAIVARRQAPEAETRNLLVPVLSVAPYLVVIFWLGGDVAALLRWPGLAFAAGIIYLMVLSVRVLQAAYGSARYQAATLAMTLVLVAPWMVSRMNLDTRLWVPADTQEDQDSDDAAAEAEPLLYDQPARIEAAVERVLPSQPGTPAVFFVGFAGDGSPAIFKREAVFAQSVFADHFGSADRSLELINDVDDRESYPLATVSGLADALKLLAGRMNLEQDVLVLTLTSHGSREGLEVANGKLPLLQLGPAELRQALDEAGIKWRVIVVSACYSGVFIEPLQTDATLIATASDSEHTSFGCDDDRDLTWFGEAFLKDAVPTHGHSRAGLQKGRRPDPAARDGPEGGPALQSTDFRGTRHPPEAGNAGRQAPGLRHRPEGEASVTLPFLWLKNTLSLPHRAASRPCLS
jgi:hypothetical protein